MYSSEALQAMVLTASKMHQSQYIGVFPPEDLCAHGDGLEAREDCELCLAIN